MSSGGSSALALSNRSYRYAEPEWARLSTDASRLSAVITKGRQLGNVGVGEMLILAVIALAVVGPERLPEVARSVGRALAKFRAESSRGLDELKRVADLGDVDLDLRELSAEARGAVSSVGDVLVEVQSDARVGESVRKATH